MYITHGVYICHMITMQQVEKFLTKADKGELPPTAYVKAKIRKIMAAYGEHIYEHMNDRYNWMCGTLEMPTQK